MGSFAKYDLWPTTDLANIIQALELAGAGGGGEFERGWRAALMALRVAIGVNAPTPADTAQTPAPVQAPRDCDHTHSAPVILDVTPRLRRDDPEPAPLGPSRAGPFDGIEDSPWAIRAFANLK